MPERLLYSMDVGGKTIDMKDKLYIKGSKLIYELDSENKWELLIEKIKLIGEYTTSAGPYTDDYFFVFIEKEDEWWQAPTTAIEHEAFWRELGLKLGTSLVPGLAASVDWKTRVIFPPELEDKSLFNVIKVNTEDTPFWKRIIGLGSENERLVLSDEAQQLFKS